MNVGKLAIVPSPDVKAMMPSHRTEGQASDLAVAKSLPMRACGPLAIGRENYPRDADHCHRSAGWSVAEVGREESNPQADGASYDWSNHLRTGRQRLPQRSAKAASEGSLDQRWVKRGPRPVHCGEFSRGAGDVCPSTGDRHPRFSVPARWPRLSCADRTVAPAGRAPGSRGAGTGPCASSGRAS